MRIPEIMVDQIHQAAHHHLLEIVQEDLGELKKKGSNWWAKSPFKEEQTPSFSVNPQKGIFKCFATGIGGTAIKYVMLRHCGGDRPDNYRPALEWVAARYGIDLSEMHTPEQRAQADRIRGLHELMEQAWQYYRANLDRSEPAQDYLLERGLDQACMEIGELGLSPEGWDSLLRYFQGMDVPTAHLVDAGLVSLSQKNGKHYDFHRNRIMFPIRDVSGRIVSFGGRTWHPSQKDQPKYINGRDTTIYNKSEVLYFLDKAWSSIQQANQAILLEGYTDTISLHRAGITQAVATCGTALTEPQAQLLKRYTSTVLLIRDGDEAGQRAHARDIKVLLQAGLEVNVCTLPEGEDPDSYVRELEREGFVSYIKEQAQPWEAWLWGYLLPKQGEKEAAREVMTYVGLLTDALDREHLTKQVSQLTGYTVETLQSITQDGRPINYLERRLSWEGFEFLDGKLRGIPFDRPPRRAEDGGVELAYFEDYEKPLTQERNGQQVQVVRSTRQGEGLPNGVYKPLQVQANGMDGHLSMTLDEITSEWLSSYEVPALGLATPTNFKASPRSKKPAKGLRTFMKEMGFNRLLYWLPGEAFHLPQTNRKGDEPYIDVDVASVATQMTRTLSLLQTVFPNTRIWTIRPNHACTDYDTRAARWVESFLLHAQATKLDVAETVKNALWTASGVKDEDYQQPYLIAEEITNQTEASFQEALRIDSPQRFFEFHGEALGRTFKFGRELWEVNTFTAKVEKVMDDEPKEVILRDCKYLAAQKGSGWKSISNFFLEGGLRIMSSEQSFTIFRVVKEDGKRTREVIIADEDFGESTRFKKRIRSITQMGGLNFKGSTANLDEIYEMAAVGVDEATNVGEKMGFDSPSDAYGAQDKKYWIFGNGILNGQFCPADEKGLASVDGVKYFLPALSEIREPGEKRKKYIRQQDFVFKRGSMTLDAWLEQMFRVYLENAHKVVCFSLLAMYYDLALSLMEQVPLMHIFAPPGSGKDVIRASMMRLWSEKIHWMDLQSGKITPAAFVSFFQQYTNVLSIVNELNPSSIDERLIHPLKSTYQGKLGEKRADRSGNALDSGEVRSAVLLMGQEPIWHFKAINQRCIPVMLPNRKFTKEDRKALEELTAGEKEGMGQIFEAVATHRDLMEDHLRETVSHLQDLIGEELKVHTPSSERLIYNWAVMMAPLWVLINHGKISYPWSPKQMVAYAAREIEEHDRQMQQNGLLDIFWNEFIQPYYGAHTSFAPNDNHVFHDTELERLTVDGKLIDLPEGVINLNLGNIFPRFEEFIGRKRYRIENSSKGDLQRELMSHPAFIRSTRSGAWLGYQKNEMGRPYTDGNGNPKKYRSSALQFDAARLEVEIRQAYEFEGRHVPPEVQEDDLVKKGEFKQITPPGDMPTQGPNPGEKAPF